jgi:hypothetical protein
MFMATEDILSSALVGPEVLAFLMAFLGLFLVLIAVAYVYMAWTTMTIAKKLNHPNPWLAWIPFANISLILMLGGFHWAWVFLYIASFIPAVGWIASLGIAVLVLLSLHRVGNKLNFAGWSVWLTFIPFLGEIWMYVYMGILAWKK